MSKYDVASDDVPPELEERVLKMAIVSIPWELVAGDDNEVMGSALKLASTFTKASANVDNMAWIDQMIEDFWKPHHQTIFDAAMSAKP